MHYYTFTLQNCGLQKVLRETDNNIKRDCLKTSEVTKNLTVTMDIAMEVTTVLYLSSLNYLLYNRRKSVVIIKTEQLLLCFKTVSKLLVNYILFCYFILHKGQSQGSDIDKLIVAAIDKSCAANDYFIVFTSCENRTTIFPGLNCQLY